MPPKTRKRAAKEAEDVENVAPEHKVKKEKIAKALELDESTAFSGQVDPDKHFPHRGYHVYVEDGVVYDATLNQTDLKANNNKFYILQVLKHDSSDSFYFWAHWGRVGYSGQNSCSQLSLEQAKREFCRKFQDKTGNSFENRDSFEKKTKKYDLIQIDYGKTKPAPIVDGVKEDESIPSELDSRVKAVIDTICDLRTLELYMKNHMKYDTDRSPLGALKKSQIKAGFEILSKIEKLLLDNKTSEDYQSLVNDYLTKIPHSFGMKRLDSYLNSLDQIKEELALLEALADVELANSVLKEEPSVRSINPSDRNYERMHCKMTPLETKDKDYKMVETYLKNTHGDTHSNYKMKLVNVFKIERENEEDNFRADLDNHRLLWHGSGLANWFGILLRGLRIAPPEAPSTGYMFGKGVYFADACSKSANYCRAQIGQRGFLTLAQVALGNMRELTDSDYNANKLPEDKHSTFGVGQSEPSSRGSKKVVIDGKSVAVPCGRLAKKKDSDDCRLLYNEFIVYDVNQVRLRYLVEVEFMGN